MATHFRILAWKIPWAENPGGLQSMGLQRVGHDWTLSTAIVFLWLLSTRRIESRLLISPIWNPYDLTYFCRLTFLHRPPESQNFFQPFKTTQRFPKDSCLYDLTHLVSSPKYFSLPPLTIPVHLANFSLSFKFLLNCFLFCETSIPILFSRILTTLSSWLHCVLHKFYQNAHDILFLIGLFSFFNL